MQIIPRGFLGMSSESGKGIGAFLNDLSFVGLDRNALRSEIRALVRKLERHIGHVLSVQIYGQACIVQCSFLALQRPQLAAEALMHGESLELVEAIEAAMGRNRRSEEHTSELQSQSNLVCRLLLEKKKKQKPPNHPDTLRTTHD